VEMMILVNKLLKILVIVIGSENVQWGVTRPFMLIILRKVLNNLR
jgi:hypothetical protein